MKSRIGKVAAYRGEEFITCQEVITFLLEYLSKDLTPEEELHFERHLAICPSCVAYLKTYKQAMHLGRAAMRGETGAASPEPPELGIELVRAILQSRA
ncbi:MAG: zf-HC2 domain-containing protein [Thermoanaerobaculia bacterium]